MLNPTRWNPWTELAGLHREFDSMFSRVFGDTVRPQSADSFAPAADVRRNDDTWKIWLALPGISPEKVEINVTGQTLWVRGERTPQQETARTEPVISEITYGRFEREFAVPDEVDADHVQATYRNGMLELTLPLKEGAKPRRIEVQAAPESAEVKQLHAA
jgi:HSP20 family protein